MFIRGDGVIIVLSLTLVKIQINGNNNFCLINVEYKNIAIKKTKCFYIANKIVLTEKGYLGHLEFTTVQFS